MSEVVTRAKETPSLTTMPQFPKPVIEPGEPICFAYDVKAQAGEGQSKSGVIISPRPDYSSWEIRCDEGTAMGGEDAAPSPLGYLIIGVAFCMLTHLQRYLEKVPMQVDQIKVEIRAEYAMLPPEPEKGIEGDGRCDAYTCHVLIDSPEPSSKIEHLVSVCRDACMAMATVATAVPTSTKVFINGNADGIAV